MPKLQVILFLVHHIDLLLILQPNDTAELEKVEPLKDNENKAGKCKHQVNYSL